MSEKERQMKNYKHTRISPALDEKGQLLPQKWDISIAGITRGRVALRRCANEYVYYPWDENTYTPEEGAEIAGFLQTLNAALEKEKEEKCSESEK